MEFAYLIMGLVMGIKPADQFPSYSFTLNHVNYVRQPDGPCPQIHRYCSK